MIDLVLRLRRFKTLDTLERVAPRMTAKAAAVSLRDELNTLAALDHRRAEIATGMRYDAGKVPAYAWAMVK